MRRIPETVNYKGYFISYPKDKADIFNKYFSEQFSCTSDYNIDINFENVPYSSTYFNESDVFKLVRKINANKAAGPDHIHGKLLKFSAGGVAKTLSIIPI